MARDQGARELKILNAIAEALNSAPDVQQALDRTMAAVAELLGLHTAWVWLIDRESDQFYHAGALNLPPYLQEPVRMTGRSCWCIDSYRKGELTPKNIDVLECSRLRPAVKAKAEDLTQGLAYHASIPLYFQETPLGILNVTGPSWRKLTRGELRLLSTIAYQVGIAIERARLAEESTRLARAEERARIAREIHDTLAQGLTAIALHLEGALHQLDRTPDRARQRLERALATARESLEEARRSVLNLRTPLDGKPLAEALVGLGRAFTSETGIRVKVRAGERLTLPLRVESELYRIAQEALANIHHHAHAREVGVVLALRAGRVRLTIRDDGRGFDPADIPESSHGIQGMRERARLLGATLSVASRLSAGTRITVAVPLDGPAE